MKLIVLELTELAAPFRKRPRSPSMCRPPTVQREGGFPVVELHGLEGRGSGFVASSVFEKLPDL